MNMWKRNLFQNTAEFDWTSTKDMGSIFSSLWDVDKPIYLSNCAWLFVYYFAFSIAFPCPWPYWNTCFWVATDWLRTTDLVYCEGWECDFSRGESTSGWKEKEREQLLGSGRSWHHHLWAPRVALGARQSQPVPGRITAIQPEQIHCTLHHPNDTTKRQAITRPQNCRFNLVLCVQFSFPP